jgi:hypothetical protein
MKKPTAGFASGGGFETLLVLLAVSTLAGSACSLNRNNSGGRRFRNGRHRGALRDGERQTHGKSIAQEPAITRKNVFGVPGGHYRQNPRKLAPAMNI